MDYFYYFFFLVSYLIFILVNVLKVYRLINLTLNFVKVMNNLISNKNLNTPFGQK